MANAYVISASRAGHSSIVYGVANVSRNFVVSGVGVVPDVGPASLSGLSGIASTAGVGSPSLTRGAPPFSVFFRGGVL
jgi:hypothetical protein